MEQDEARIIQFPSARVEAFLAAADQETDVKAQPRLENEQIEFVFRAIGENLEIPLRVDDFGDGGLLSLDDVRQFAKEAADEGDSERAASCTILDIVVKEMLQAEVTAPDIRRHNAVVLISHMFKLDLIDEARLAAWIDVTRDIQTELEAFSADPRPPA